MSGPNYSKMSLPEIAQLIEVAIKGEGEYVEISTSGLGKIAKRMRLIEYEHQILLTQVEATIREATQSVREVRLQEALDRANGW